MYVSCVLLCNYCATDSEILFTGPVELRFGRHETDFLKTQKTSMHRLREKAIAEYHDLLAADETLTPRVFEKLRTAMRKKPAALRRTAHWCSRLGHTFFMGNSSKH